MGKDVLKTVLQNQPPLAEGEDWPFEQVTLAAQVMSGSSFEAFHSPNQRYCRIGALCPLCENSKQVTQP